MVILTLASVIDTSQWPTGSVLQGMARHRPIALMATGAALANLVLSVLLVQSVGLIGVALGTLLPTTIVCLGFVLPYAMRVIGISLAQALRDIFLPPLASVLLMAFTLYGLQQLIRPITLPALIVIVGIGTLMYLAGYISFGASRTERQAYRSLALGSARSATAWLRRFGTLTR